jgi:L-fucose mutarotase/ribose pyranase (RbsD/FucU family)
MRSSLAFFAILITLAAPVAGADPAGSNWQTTLLDRLPLYGHRNWIVIADSAYPAQSREGIETIVSNADHFQVLQTVMSALERSKHVRPVVYTDRELNAIQESDAPGISVYRQQLSSFLHDVTVNTMPHEKIIGQLDQVSQTFRVLIIKTKLALPYTSVFLQLDCAYWSPDAERRVRSALAAQR